MALFKSDNGGLSKSRSFKTIGFIVLTVLLGYAFYKDKPYCTDLYVYYAGFIGLTAMTKGAVDAYKHNK